MRHAGDEAAGSGQGAPGGAGQVRQGTAGPNKSRYRGVSYDKKKRKWRVQIKVHATVACMRLPQGGFVRPPSLNRHERGAQCPVLPPHAPFCCC